MSEPAEKPLEGLGEIALFLEQLYRERGAPEEVSKDSVERAIKAGWLPSWLTLTGRRRASPSRIRAAFETRWAERNTPPSQLTLFPP